MARRSASDEPVPGPTYVDAAIALLHEMVDGGGEAGGVVAAQHATGRWLDPVGKGRIVGLDEDDAVVRESPEDIGGIADARSQGHAIGPMLGQDGQGSLLPFGVVQAGHHEDGVPTTGGGFLEPGGHLAVDGVGQVVEQQPEDVRPACAQAPSGGIGDVSEVARRVTDRGPGRLADPGIVLECARCGRLGRARQAGDVGKHHATLGRSIHQARLKLRPSRS